MSDLSKYEVRKGRVWRKHLPKVKMPPLDWSRYEVVVESGKPCPDRDLEEALRIKRQTETLPRGVLAYIHMLFDSPRARYSLFGDINPLDDI